VAQSKTKIGVATIPTYPDAEVWVTDTDPVSGRGGGHFLPANADAVRGVRFAGLVVRQGDATPELLTAFPGQDEVDYARESSRNAPN
jgi:hypothetical protein